MLRLPLLFLFTISIFVNGVPMSPTEDHDKSSVDAATNVKNETTVIVPPTNSSIINASSNQVNNTKESLNGVKTSATSGNVANVTESEKHKCDSSTNEQDDMRNCKASPSDSDEEIDDDNQKKKEEKGNEKDNKKVGKKEDKSEEKMKGKKDNKDEGKNEEKNDKNDEKKGEKVNNVTVELLNSTEISSHVSYEIVSTTVSSVKNVNETESSKVSTVPTVTDDITISSKSVAPLVAENYESQGKVAEVKSADRNKGMPSGVIALVTAICFGIAIGIVYVGMIVWRRYIEYRYGHRELLVNELEFDTNDLRHFEL